MHKEDHLLEPLVPIRPWKRLQEQLLLPTSSIEAEDDLIWALAHGKRLPYTWSTALAASKPAHALT